MSSITLGVAYSSIKAFIPKSMEIVLALIVVVAFIS
jgi:hypothetical protein